MSRHGYVDVWDADGDTNLYRGAVERAIRGRRGQALLKDLLAALDAMPEKRLIRDELITAEGEVCALGCLAKSRNQDVSGIDPEDPDAVASAFNIAPSLAREVEYINDEGSDQCTPERRWINVRRWVASQIIQADGG